MPIGAIHTTPALLASRLADTLKKITWLQVVPEAVRTSVYAFDKGIVLALGAVSTPLSGLLAERLFGAESLFVDHAHTMQGGASISAHAPAPAPSSASLAAEQHARNLTNAQALENGLLVISITSLVLKFFIYGFLYCESFDTPPVSYVDMRAHHTQCPVVSGVTLFFAFSEPGTVENRSDMPQGSMLRLYSEQSHLSLALNA